MQSKRKNLIRSTVISVVIFCLFAFLYLFTGVFDFLENKSYDLRVRLFANAKQPSEEIFVIVLNQDSLDWAQQERGWSWPWPRSAYGELVDFFNIGEAYSLAFDVLYTEPSIYGIEDDKKFADACDTFGGVVQTVFLSNQYGNTDFWHTEAKKPSLLVETRGLEFKDSHYAKKALFPIDLLTKTAAGLGNISSTLDADGVVRRASFMSKFDNQIIPSLSLATYTVRNSGDSQVTYDEKNNQTLLFGKTLPGKPFEPVLLRYRESIDSYIPYSARDILESKEALDKGEDPLLDPKMFKNGYVFFCFYAPGLFDICSTPISTSYPGAGVHITALDNLLQNDFIRPLPTQTSILLILFAACFACFIQQISFKASIICVPVGIILLTSSVTFGYIEGLHIPIVAPLFTLVSSFTVALLVSYNTEYKQKRYISSIFKQYLSPAVIDQLVEHPEQVKLGGEVRELSMFFSDIENFTTLSEKLSPEELTEFLNEYLSAMSDIILDSGGTIDKYEGDAIIAFWNAPLSIEDHAKRAIEAAVQCQQTLKDLNKSLVKKIGTTIAMRIGINTGNVVVGNMGSKNRFDYTMIGDAVNLTARLEGLNKQFGTYTLCSEQTMNAAQKSKTNLQFREISKVAVVGKSEAVKVFEPLTQSNFENTEESLTCFKTALHLFYAGNFEDAIAEFKKIQNTDKAAQNYINYCKNLIDIKPSNWDGVWRATQK